jgi:hypothetical protein
VVPLRHASEARESRTAPFSAIKTVPAGMVVSKLRCQWNSRVVSVDRTVWTSVAGWRAGAARRARCGKGSRGRLAPSTTATRVSAQHCHSTDVLHERPAAALLHPLALSLAGPLYGTSSKSALGCQLPAPF